MLRTFFHGTSADNLESILANGLSRNEIKLWSCSLDAVYVWGVEELTKYDGSEDDEQEYKIQRGFGRASESAQIACAIAFNCRLVVIELSLDDDIISPDDSAENMLNSGAVCIHNDIPISSIVSIKISNDLSLLKGYFINMLSTNEYSAIEFTPLEIKVANAFSNAQLFPEDIEYLIEWENVGLPILNHRKRRAVKNR